VKNFLKRIALRTAVVSGSLYGVDELIARLRPQGSVEVEVFYTIARKDNRTDYMKSDSQMEPCVNSALTHMRLRPCWYVAKYPKLSVDVGKQKDDFWRR